MSGNGFAISVIIPTHNRASLLTESLASLCDQTLPASDFEVVVVDDGSTDHTREVCDEFSERIGLQYHRIANSGIAAAKNMGLFASRGEIAYFFDDDDVADPNLLAAHVAAHREYPDDRIAILGYTTWHPDLEITPLMNYVTEVGQHLFSYPSLEADKMLDFRHFWGGRASAKRRFLVQHGVFNQDFDFAYEDIELGFRLSQYGFAVIFRPEAVSYMLRSLTFDDFARRCEKQGKSLFRLYDLHPERPIADYCRLRDLNFDPERLDAATAEVRRLEHGGLKLASNTARAPLLLHEAYGEAFRQLIGQGWDRAARWGQMASSVSDRGSDDGGEFGPPGSGP